MAFEIDHDGMRKLAKALSVRTNREIKLTDIYNDVASIFGMKGDAMMHALKNKRASETAEPGCGSSVSSGHHPDLGLHTKQYFAETMLNSIEDRNSWNVAVCVIHLDSLEEVRAQSGAAAAQMHLREFAKLLTLKPMSDALFAYLDGSFFLAGWPKLDCEVDPSYRIMSLLNNWSSDLDAQRETTGLVSDIRHNFCAAAFHTDNLSMNGQVIEKAIENCRKKASNLAVARKEFPAFPRLTYVD